MKPNYITPKISSRRLLNLLFVTVAICLHIVTKVHAQNNVGIGTTTPNTKAVLELKATDKGFLAPRMSTSQMNAIVVTATESALLIYNTDSACYHFYNGTMWKNLCVATGAGGTDTAAINKAIKNYLASHATTIINILNADTSIFNVATINQATINLLKVDTSIANVAIINNATINNLTADTSILNYANINNATIDSVQANYIDANEGNFNTLNVGGKDISQIMTDSIAAQAWLLKGNITTNSNKLGTLNARDLHIVANGAEKITIAQGTGNVGINQTLPSQALDVVGNLQFSGALMPANNAGITNEILISQGVGNAPLWVNQSTLTGVTGPTGSQGPAGTTGAVGPQGPAGSAGSNGAVGPAGPTGSNGTNGAVGALVRKVLRET